MTREKAREQVRAILVEQLGDEAEAVTDDSSFQKDLNADSLDLVELIMEIEDRFKVKIPDDVSERLTTVGEALDYLLEDKLPPIADEATEAVTKEVPTKAS